MALDAQSQALLEALRIGEPVQTLTAVQARQASRDRRAGVGRPPHRPLYGVRDTTIPGPGGPLLLRIYRPVGVATALVDVPGVLHGFATLGSTVDKVGHVPCLVASTLADGLHR